MTAAAVCPEAVPERFVDAAPMDQQTLLIVKKKNGESPVTLTSTPVGRQLTGVTDHPVVGIDEDQFLAREGNSRRPGRR